MQPLRHRLNWAVPTMALSLTALGSTACTDAAAPGSDSSENEAQRLTVYANAGYGPGSTPVEVWINGAYIGTITDAYNPPPMLTCDQPGGVSIDVPRSSVQMMVRRTTDGAEWGPYEIQRSLNASCVVQWISASLFPPLGGDEGEDATATHCLVFISANGGPLGLSEWRNNCDFKIHFAWFDQGFCGPTGPSPEGYYLGCASNLGPGAYGNETNVQGRVVWGACRDPYLPLRFRNLDGNGLPSIFNCRR